MAWNSMILRAWSSVVPFAVRSTGFRRTFHSAISAVICIEKGSLGCEIGRRNLRPFLQFSTTTALRQNADGNLIRVLESEIDCANEPTEVEDIPHGFPFEIIDNPGSRTILLKRTYQDETIKVEVDAPSESFAENDDEKNEDDDIPPSIPLVLSISKASGQHLEFGVSAFPDEITIETLSVKNSESSEDQDQLAYEGPDFADLDENLQKAFHKYLEIRGIRPSTTNFLFDYMRNKDDGEYLHWLKNLKSFMEK